MTISNLHHHLHSSSHEADITNEQLNANADAFREEQAWDEIDGRFAAGFGWGMCDGCLDANDVIHFDGENLCKRCAERSAMALLEKDPDFDFTMI